MPHFAAAFMRSAKRSAPPSARKNSSAFKNSSPAGEKSRPSTIASTKLACSSAPPISVDDRLDEIGVQQRAADRAHRRRVKIGERAGAVGEDVPARAHDHGAGGHSLERGGSG